MSTTPKEEGADVPQDQKVGWHNFLKSLAHMKGDLSSMTAPPFILSPTSLTEFPAYWAEHADIFADISEGTSAEDRMERVLLWFISTLKGQFTARNEKLGSEKKPLNPVLGEQFFGVWPDKEGRGETVLIAEQVKHHPPVTAYFIENKKARIALQGHSGQKTSFSGAAINVKQNGHAMIFVTPKATDMEERYLITLPKLRIDGLIWGSPYIELTDSSSIQASTGYGVQIEYKGKGYFSGKAHQFKAKMTQGSKTIQNYEGEWTGVSYIGSSKGEVFYDADRPKEEVTVKPISEQGEWESRRLWEKVANGIRDGDYDTAGKEKSTIENEQRQRRKDEEAAGTTWKLWNFEHQESDPEFRKLVALMDQKAYPPTEDGYVFTGEAYKKLLAGEPAPTRLSDQPAEATLKV